MKIIAFWSNVHGQSRTTSNMIAVAAATAFENNYKCILTQTHFNLNNLESYLIGSREYSQEIFFDVGIDGLARSIKLEPLDKEVIDNYSIPLLNNMLYLLPGTTSNNKTIYINALKESISKILLEVKKHYDLLFIDLNSGLDEISEVVINQADLVVVNLSQNKSVLDDYFYTKYYNNRKVMYLFGSYDRSSSYNIHNLRLRYRQLNKSTVSVIPNCTGFMDAQSNGFVIEFMKNNLILPKEDNKYFIDNVKATSQKLMKLAGYRKGSRNVS